MTREEAVRLVTTQGFTYWQEGVAAGNMARPYSHLSMLGEADFARLTSMVISAKQRASGESGDLQRADAFESAIDPALVEFVNKYRESQTSAAASQGLRGLFGAQWVHLVPDCRDFLITAEVLRDDLASRTESDPSIDFSPAVAMYSKALEKNLLEKLFRPFVSSTQAHRLPATGTKKDWARSQTALQEFVAGGRELTLGDMAFCLLNLGCRMRQVAENGFAEFLRTNIGDLVAFCDDYRFPKRLIEYVTDFRNKSAHVAKLSKDDCMAARAFLLEEPIQLLILLEKFLRPSDSEVVT